MTLKFLIPRIECSNNSGTFNARISSQSMKGIIQQSIRLQLMRNSVIIRRIRLQVFIAKVSSRFVFLLYESVTIL